MRLEKGRRRKALINVTSLIDVVFLLLIFFVVTSTFLERPGIDLSLPEAGSSASEVAEVSVRIAADGGLYVGESPVTPEELTGVLEARLREAGTTEVTLEADVEHRRIVPARRRREQSGASSRRLTSSASPC